MSPRLFCGALKCHGKYLISVTKSGKVVQGLALSPEDRGFSACCMFTRLFPYVSPFDELPSCQGCTQPPLALSPEGSSSAPETPLRYKTVHDEQMDGIIMLTENRKHKNSLVYFDIRG